MLRQVASIYRPQAGIVNILCRRYRVPTFTSLDALIAAARRPAFGRPETPPRGRTFRPT